MEEAQSRAELEKTPGAEVEGARLALFPFPTALSSQSIVDQQPALPALLSALLSEQTTGEAG